MGVVLRVVGQAVVDNVGEVVHIESACCHVGGYKELDAALAELLHREVALLLRQFAVQGIGIVAVLDELVGYLLRLHTGAAEYDAIDMWVVVDDTLQGEVFVLRVHHIIYVVHVLGALVLVAYHDFVGIGEVVLGNSGNLLAHGGGEEQRVAVGRHILEDAVDAVGEAHIEHLVGLVEHYVVHGREIHYAAFHEVDEAARCGHDDMYAATHVAYLVFDGGAAIHGHHAQSLHILGEGGKVIGNLQA